MKKEEVSRQVDEYDIIAITETKIKTKDQIYFKGYESHFQGRKVGVGNVTAGGIVLLIKQGIKYTRLPIKGNISKNCETMGLKTNIGNKDVNIVLVYRRPGQIEKKNSWKQLIRDNRGKGEFILIGDFNAHNRTWNCATTDANGVILANETEEEGLYLINGDTMSRMGEGNDKDSNLDLMFATKGVVDTIKYRQEEDSWGSDHFPVEFEIGQKVEIYRKRTNRISLKRTNWKTYEEIMEERGKEMGEGQYDQLNVEGKYVNIKDMMIEAVNIATNRKDIDKGTSIGGNREKG